MFSLQYRVKSYPRKCAETIQQRMSMSKGLTDFQRWLSCFEFYCVAGSLPRLTLWRHCCTFINSTSLHHFLQRGSARNLAACVLKETRKIIWAPALSTLKSGFLGCAPVQLINRAATSEPDVWDQILCGIGC